MRTRHKITLWYIACFGELSLCENLKVFGVQANFAVVNVWRN
jgi:hypothetical protein